MPEEKKFEMPKTELEADELADKAGLVSGELGEKGEVSFGDGCVVFSTIPDTGEGEKLGIKVTPTKCGVAMGEQLVKHLMKASDKNFVIEIDNSKPVKLVAES